MVRHMITAFLITCSSLFSATLQERAKHAEVLLGEYEYDTAYTEYSAILKDLPPLSQCDKPSLEFAYWIYRERSYAAFFLDDLRTMQWDVEKMKEILVLLGFSPEYGMDEYYYAMELARRGKALMEKYAEDSPSMPLPTLGIGSWLKNTWNQTKVGTEKFRAFVDESYCRLVHNEERLEFIQAQKRSQELYYPHLVHCKETMNGLAMSIQERDSRLFHDFIQFGIDHSLLLGIDALSVIGGVSSAQTGNIRQSVAAFSTTVATSLQLMDHLKKTGGPLWDAYQTLHNDRARLTRMNLDNREASYVKCILEKKMPNLQYAPEKDNLWGLVA